MVCSDRAVHARAGRCDCRKLIVRVDVLEVGGGERLPFPYQPRASMNYKRAAIAERLTLIETAGPGYAVDPGTSADKRQAGGHFPRPHSHRAVSNPSNKPRLPCPWGFSFSYSHCCPSYSGEQRGLYWPGNGRQRYPLSAPVGLGTLDGCRRPVSYANAPLADVSCSDQEAA